MPDRLFGAPPGVPVGATFETRVDLREAGVHRPTQAGICGSNDGEGAESIVLSGGYGDDVFAGDTLLYTGQGGRSAETKRQVDDQPWNGYNASLGQSTRSGRPVRVARLVEERDGRTYRYEGLYRVDRYWRERGGDGFLIWRFGLVRLSPGEARAWGQTWIGGAPEDEAAGDEPNTAAEPPAPWRAAPRQTLTTQRLVRDSAVGRRVKAWHDHTCQTCGMRLVTPTGPYAEAAHIRPLGHPHDGPDAHDNVLCLCPSCHVRFDAGAVTILDGDVIVSLPGCSGPPLLPALRRVRRHHPGAAHVAYHREHIAFAR